MTKTPKTKGTSSREEREVKSAPALILSLMKRVAAPETTNSINNRHGLTRTIGMTSHGSGRGLMAPTAVGPGA